MHKLTPFVSALFAVAYIVLIVTLINTFVGGPDPDTIVLPMMMLSLLVLSAAIMGFLFLGRPVMLYLDGQKKEAVAFFGKTVGIFACFALLFVIIIAVMY